MDGPQRYNNRYTTLFTIWDDIQLQLEDTGHQRTGPLDYLLSCYHRLIPSETRYWFYKLRHWQEVTDVQTRVFPSAKGDFSLRRYTERECLFIHITKAAGTSVALSLMGELPYHYTARQYRVIYGRRTFNRFYKFAFVRNPWDRLYSAYSYLKAGGWNDQDAEWANTNLSNIHDFESFLLDWLTPERMYSHIHLWPQTDFVCDQAGYPLIDELCYFESIQEDFRKLSTRLNSEATLVHTNSSKRDSFKSIYSDAMKKKVGELYKKDAVNFGYTFDNLQKRVVRNGQFTVGS